MSQLLALSARFARFHFHKFSLDVASNLDCVPVHFQHRNSFATVFYVGIRESVFFFYLSSKYDVIDFTNTLSVKSSLDLFVFFFYCTHYSYKKIDIQKLNHCVSDTDYASIML